MKLETAIKINNFGCHTFTCSVVFWLAETIAFGWNKTPCCTAEAVCDHIAIFGIIIGWALSIVGKTLALRHTPNPFKNFTTNCTCHKWTQQ